MKHSNSKSELTPKAIEALKSQILRLPLVDQICILSMSVMASKEGDPIGAVLGLTELTARMAVHFPIEKRFRIAERLRSVADHLEMETVSEVTPC